MPPKRGKKYSSVTALPGGSELEALAWGYHTAKGVRGDRIAGLVNNATDSLLSGTGRAEWAVHIPDLGVQLPASRQSVLDGVGSEQLAAAFAASGRRKNAYEPLNPYDQDQALKALSGAKNSRSAFGTGSTSFPDGSILTRAKNFKEPAHPPLSGTPTAKAKRATRAQKKQATDDEALRIEDQGNVAVQLFEEEAVAVPQPYTDAEMDELLTTLGAI